MPDPTLNPDDKRRQAFDMEELNREEISRQRDRLHELGNVLQGHEARFMRSETVLEDVGRKLDAMQISLEGRLAEIRAEIKEDLTDIKTETRATNGKVAEHDRQISKLQGGLVVIAAGMPVLTGLLLYALTSLLAVH